MTGVLLVINAGSSSIKFSVYEVESGAPPLALRYRGEVDGFGARPRFAAHAASGEELKAEALRTGARHDDALRTILDWIEARADGTEIAAAGHRVVHGGVRYAAPSFSRRTFSASSRRSSRSRPCTSLTTWRRSGRWPR